MKKMLLNSNQKLTKEQMKNVKGGQTLSCVHCNFTNGTSTISATGNYPPWGDGSWATVCAGYFHRSVNDFISATPC